MADLTAFPTKHVIDRLVPVLVIGHSVLLTHLGRELCRIAKVVGVISVADGGEEFQVIPAAQVCPGTESRNRRLGYDVERCALEIVPSRSVEPIE